MAICATTRLLWATALPAVALITSLAGPAPAWATDAETPPERANDNFGWAIATDGARLAIAAPGSNEDAFDGGVVHVYERNGAGSSPWDRVATLSPDGDVLPHARFGVALALSGDTLLVADEAGQLHGFSRVGGVWEHGSAPALDDEDPHRATFGDSLALVGDTAVIGARPAPRDGALEGAAFVFARDGDDWIQTHALAPAPSVPGSTGWGVRTDGDILVMPSEQELFLYSRAGDDWIADDPLALRVRELAVSESRVFAHGGDEVYVVERNGEPGDAWSVTHTLEASADTYAYGHALAATADTLFVGSNRLVPEHDHEADLGYVAVYTRDDDAWSLAAELFDEGAPARTRYFGWSIAATDGELFVGSREDDRDGYHAGAVLRFDGAADDWGTPEIMLASDGDGGCQCRADAGRETAWLPLLLLPLALLRRRGGSL